jgi:hypothetical protein
MGSDATDVSRRPPFGTIVSEDFSIAGWRNLRRWSDEKMSNLPGGSLESRIVPSWGSGG